MDEQELFSKLISTDTDVKTGEKNAKDITAWSYDVEGHGQKCVARCCDLAHKTVDEVHKVSTPCLDDHQVKREDMTIVGQFSESCSQTVLTCLSLARLGRPDLLWTVYVQSRKCVKNMNPFTIDQGDLIK